MFSPETLHIPAFILWSLSLLLVAIHDSRTMRIPDWLNVICAVSSLLLAYTNKTSPQDMLTGILAGFMIPYSFRWVYWRWKRKIVLGMGDVKYMAAVGSVLGMMGVWGVLLLGVTITINSNEKNSQRALGPSLSGISLVTVLVVNFSTSKL